jgi:predicted hydrocarbon binding protein
MTPKNLCLESILGYANLFNSMPHEIGHAFVLRVNLIDSVDNVFEIKNEEDEDEDRDDEDDVDEEVEEEPEG